MSKVTFADLYNDYLDVNTSVGDCKKVQKIEIVPRKIVEMIIEKCAGDASVPKSSDYSVGVSTEANCIKSYAELLLHEFENGKI